jgi:hypothetical protein
MPPLHSRLPLPQQGHGSPSRQGDSSVELQERHSLNLMLASIERLRGSSSETAHEMAASNSVRHCGQYRVSVRSTKPRSGRPLTTPLRPHLPQVKVSLAPTAESILLPLEAVAVSVIPTVQRRGEGVWIARLPQEDFCQATGRPPTQRYERDDGPSMNEILEILASSAYAERDRANFALAQLTFWLLAATDGHAKNFSIHHLAGGAFEMTPLYDVLSMWPVIGSGANQLPLQDAKLAMAVAGKNRHYKLVDVQPRHWQALARRIGGPELWDRMQSLVDAAPRTLDHIDLPRGFPEVVISKIRQGVRDQSRKFFAGLGLQERGGG